MTPSAEQDAQLQSKASSSAVDGKSPAELASLGHSLHEAIAESQKRLAEINELLIKHASGLTFEIAGGGSVQVISPGPSIKPDTSAIVRSREVCGELFGKLFDRVISIKPKRNFRAIAIAVLTPARAQKVIAACEVDSTPYVRYG